MRCACDTFGTSQLVLGTDFPYVDGPGIGEIMTTIDELPITQAERQGILEDNALEWVHW
jgi:predicted TIM-barrel fold metal-dependent hydrolase